MNGVKIFQVSGRWRKEGRRKEERRGGKSELKDVRFLEMVESVYGCERIRGGRAGGVHAVR